MRIVARAGIMLFGLAAMAWAAMVLPGFLRDQTLISMGNALERGENYTFPVLFSQINTVPSSDEFGFCKAAARRANMIVLIKIIEDPSVVDNRTLKDTAWQKLQDATHALLECSPADSLGWLALFWLNMSKNGYAPEYGNYLQLSYDASPNEAAVALWRNRIVLGLYDRLPSRFSDLAIREFIKLVNSERLYTEMGDIFERAPPALQFRLSLALKTAESRPREVLTKMLQDRGVHAPASEPSPVVDRPWK